MAGAATLKRAIVLFGHGSRDPLWHLPMEKVRKKIEQRAPDIPVRCAYLELTGPDLPECVNELVLAGCQQINLLPMFLGIGRHAREDLPGLVAELKLQHPLLNISLLPALGEQDGLLELISQLALESPA
jgi:sirohydrochlorin cobaltochelatase